MTSYQHEDEAAEDEESDFDVGAGSAAGRCDASPLAVDVLLFVLRL